MISQSSQGNSQITLTFDLSRDIDGAAVDVETAIAAAMPLLPPGMPTPPSFNKQNPGDQPIIQLAMSSPTMRLSDVDEYAETLVAQRISAISGVAQVSVFGAPKFAVHIQVDPNKPESIAEGVVRMLSDARMASGFARRAKEKVRTYNWGTVAEATLRVYEQAARDVRYE